VERLYEYFKNANLVGLHLGAGIVAIGRGHVAIGLTDFVGGNCDRNGVGLRYGAARVCRRKAKDNTTQ
jgi:hypothetical protein